MWCEHNLQNPHRSSLKWGSMEWQRGDARTAGIFDVKCSQGTNYNHPTSDPSFPLPPRQWKRCCSCVFGDDVQTRGSGRSTDPVLRYDVPIAPLIKPSATYHVAATETQHFYRRNLLTTIIAYAIPPTTTTTTNVGTISPPSSASPTTSSSPSSYLLAEGLSLHLLHALQYFYAQCKVSGPFRGSMAETISNQLFPQSTKISKKNNNDNHSPAPALTGTHLNPRGILKRLKSRKLKKYSRLDYIEYCGTAVFISELISQILEMEQLQQQHYHHHQQGGRGRGDSGADVVVIGNIVSRFEHDNHSNTAAASFQSSTNTTNVNAFGLAYALQTFSASYCRKTSDTIK